MRAIILFAFLLANVGRITALWDTNCHVDSVDRYDWLGYFTIKSPILKTHEGVVVTYKTRNILKLTGQSSLYLQASFANDKLTISTNEKFKQFEEEYGEHQSSTIKIILDFDCADNKSESLDMRQKINDVNTHDPVLSQKVYEYHLGMTIPENYQLTKFLPIIATDDDFSNKDIYFTFLDFTDIFALQFHINNYYYDEKDYVPSLTTLKEIKAPFRKELTIVARDAGNPSRNTTAMLIVSVTDEDKTIQIHPPVFAKHLYFATYTYDHDLKLEEAITIKYGAESDTVIKQSGYEEYFKISLNPAVKGLLQIATLKPLSDKIIETTELIVVEIEAINGNLHIPGRTALVINLAHHKQGSFEEKFDNCSITAHITRVDGGSSVFSIVLFSIATFMIVLTNAVLLLCYFQKQKAPTVRAEPYPTKGMYFPEGLFKSQVDEKM